MKRIKLFLIICGITICACGCNQNSNKGFSENSSEKDAIISIFGEYTSIKGTGIVQINEKEDENDRTYIYEVDSKREKIKEYLNLIIFNDKRSSVSNLEEVTEVLVSIFNNAGFIKKLNDSNKNWLDISSKQAMSEIIEYFKNF